MEDSGNLGKVAATWPRVNDRDPIRFKIKSDCIWPSWPHKSILATVGYLPRTPLSSNSKMASCSLLLISGDILQMSTPLMRPTIDRTRSRCFLESLQIHAFLRRKLTFFSAWYLCTPLIERLGVAGKDTRSSRERDGSGGKAIKRTKKCQQILQNWSFSPMNYMF